MHISRDVYWHFRCYTKHIIEGSPEGPKVPQHFPSGGMISKYGEQKHFLLQAKVLPTFDKQCITLGYTGPILIDIPYLTKECLKITQKLHWQAFATSRQKTYKQFPGWMFFKSCEN